ncbi:TonB-linked SusC/RagA family outer membrane protein [Parabacteroides sp. PFB2-10]|uniref:SusC/RagA family TonB-linked outer membrane protein n=1 Tax=Parabacteroides sp. PFB2-10 TaxID=1742405 RepID=UPI002474E4C6|nr:TonB-dependent receptor [Parabacteroides sp. PFB2-10]MDH6314023.1 TonB-linked SusC/RagA family outer membrane protein [Parabacteroides sp. PFB2-10]
MKKHLCENLPPAGSVEKRKTKFLSTLLILFAFVSVNAWGQNVQISGNIISGSDKEPVIGANVFVEGTTTGTITDYDGNFAFEVPQNATITVSYIGFIAQSFKVGAERTFNIVLQEDAVGLEDVVVIGYGSQRKSDLTGGIVAVDASKLERVSTNNLLDKLAGQVPGLNITATTARPGDSQTIRVRGENSLSANNSPLIVLDGIPYNGSLGDIDPDIIETLSVLKDASAAAIYGSRGSNGVILIQTKKGKKGTPSVAYKGKIGMSQPERRLDVMKGPEYVTYVQDYKRLKNGLSGDQLNPLNVLNPSELDNYKAGIETDWQDLMFRNALTHSHQLSVSGGTDFTTYMASISHTSEDGIAVNTGMERTNITLNITQILNKWLTVGMGTQATQTETGGIAPSFENGLKMSPYGIDRDENGGYYEFPMDETLFAHPLANINAEQDKTRRNIFVSTFADVLLPVKGLTFRTNFGYNYRNSFTGTYYGRDTRTGKLAGGSASISNTHYYDYTWENILKYTNTFGKHKIDATALFSMQETSQREAEQKAESFVNDDAGYHNMAGGEKNQTVTSKITETALLSYMGRVNYSYANKYMVTLTARSDGYSAFGANNKYAFFPSAALAWNLSSEDFFEVSAVDMLKIRASYGANGNQAINAYQTLNRLSLAKYTWGDGSIVNGVYIPSNGVGNPNLKWETSYTFNAGVDFSLYYGRISGNVDFYVVNTKDLLMSRTVPIMNGYRTIMDNIGQTRNTGIEIALNTINVQTNDFEWSTNVNFSLNRDKIIELRGDGKDDITNKWFIGKPLRAFYDYKVIGTWQIGEEEQAAKQQKGAVPGSSKLADIAGGKDGEPDGIISAADKVVIGSKLPSFLLSMGNQFSYKRLYASFQLNGVFGQWKELHEMNMDRWMPRFNYISGMNYWTPENPTNEMSSPAYVPYDKHTYYKKMNYVQIKNITVGYTFDKNFLNKIGIAGLGVNVSVNNLYTFSNVKHVLNYGTNDIDGTYRNMITTYPSARSYILGLNLTF